jgi:hypothetical protein
VKRADKQRDSQLRARRQRVAFEAARLMAVHGIQDFRQAKLKAAQQLGVADEASLPGNSEVQEQLLDYQRLFRGQEQGRELRRRREAALEAMQFFAPFKPRLIGSVLDGSADAHSPVSLQVFSDDAEGFARFLIDANLPAKALPDRRLRIDREQTEVFPAWGFSADGLPFEIMVLPTILLRQAPLSPVDQQPMQRAGIAALRKLLSDETA